MWEAATILFTSLTIVTLVGIELARSIVHRRRERRDGIGGTQDVAMAGVALALLFAVIGFACLLMWVRERQGASAMAAAPTTQPLSTTAPSPRTADHFDVIEAVFRHEIGALAPPPPPGKIVWFLWFDGERDPPPEFIARFSDAGVEVRAGSLAVIDRHGVRRREGDGPGRLLTAWSVAWLEPHAADVEGGWHAAPNDGQLKSYRVQRRTGRWAVVKTTNRPMPIVCGY